ncbi:AMP-binding protein [Nocardioides sp. MAH-18]|uniref:Acyl-CoA synthetase n=1 Tax=Nocardioides agri TaxID=2682843 RepID=A0A6L6XR72_9ACTN|nr:MULTISPECIES: AMP-dependent synthetase/ligase [unclassified Nocardioides]MBA2953226.1 long-chain fatty acid--CoA ligase [Nocardioides sp. CGMCC 1.13656]MVQ48095.1 AMP-binding protein [Nocardioides sp. MAH-18]
MMSLAEVVEAPSLCAVFQATVAACPNVVALRRWEDGHEITWGEYGERVRRIAAGLATLGVRRGDTVAIMLTNRPEFHLVDAAVMHLGATAFSIYNTFTAEQVASLFDSAGNRVAICEQRFADTIRQATAHHPLEHIVCVDASVSDLLSLDALVESADPAFDFEATWRAVDREDLVALIYTSGTTGDPKGVELTHANLLFAVAAKAEQQREFTQEVDEERVISYLPDANLANRFAAHYVPMVTATTVTDVADGRSVLRAFADVHPTTFMGVPMIWYKLKALLEGELASAGGQHALETGLRKARLELAGEPVPVDLAEEYAEVDAAVLAAARARLGVDALVFATSGGAPIAPETLEFLLAVGVRVCEVYGLTESAASGIGNHPDRIRIGTVGQPRGGVEAQLAEDGELLLRSRGVMRGYRNDPEKTAATIDADGWLHTGDIATIDADGYVRIVDRKKDMIINSSGKNLAPTNIENAVKLASPLLSSVVAVGEGRPHIAALLVLDREQAEAFAEQHGIDDRRPEALARDPQVLAAVAEGVRRGNERLSRVEQVRAHTVLPTYWDANGDELTATTKVRRKLVNEKYAAEIESLYA